MAAFLGLPAKGPSWEASTCRGAGSGSCTLGQEGRFLRFLHGGGVQAGMPTLLRNISLWFEKQFRTARCHHSHLTGKTFCHAAPSLELDPGTTNTLSLVGHLPSTSEHLHTKQGI